MFFFREKDACWEADIIVAKPCYVEAEFGCLARALPDSAGLQAAMTVREPALVLA